MPLPPPVLIPDLHGDHIVNIRGTSFKFRAITMDALRGILAAETKPLREQLDQLHQKLDQQNQQKQKSDDLLSYTWMVGSRSMLKEFSKNWVHLIETDIHPYLTSRISAKSRSMKEYNATSTFRVLDSFNETVHAIWLTTDHHQLQNSYIRKNLEHDILSINPRFENQFKKLSDSEKISVFLGFPEEILKRAIGLTTCSIFCR